MAVDRESIKRTVPGARVYQRGRSSLWQIQYRDGDGRKIRRSSGLSDEDEAWALLEHLYARRGCLRWKEAVVAFFETKARSLSPNTLRAYGFALQAVDPLMPEVMEDVGPDWIKRHVRSRRRVVSDATIRRELAFCSSVFSFAQAELENAPPANPFLQYSKRQLVEKPREWFLTHAEFDKLRRACLEEWHQMVLVVAVNTGMRHQEICQFHKDWIQWDRRQIVIPRRFTKSKRPRVIPLLPEFYGPLKSWCETQPGPWVFSYSTPPRPYTSFQGFFRLARKRAGFTELRFHDLRHTFASWWVQRGGTTLVLRDILGHATLQMVERYAHLDTNAAHRDVARLDTLQDTLGELGMRDTDTP